MKVAQKAASYLTFQQPFKCNDFQSPSNRTFHRKISQYHLTERVARWYGIAGEVKLAMAVSKCEYCDNSIILGLKKQHCIWT